jgi:hypothetical protein
MKPRAARWPSLLYTVHPGEDFKITILKAALLGCQKHFCLLQDVGLGLHACAVAAEET